MLQLNLFNDLLDLYNDCTKLVHILSFIYRFCNNYNNKKWTTDSLKSFKTKIRQLCVMCQVEEFKKENIMPHEKR